jgi:hypothetical protein
LINGVGISDESIIDNDAGCGNINSLALENNLSSECSEMLGALIPR